MRASSSSHSIKSELDAPPLTQTQMLADSLSTVRIQAKLMRQSIDANEAMDAFKHASLMLATLRTALLTPKNYYELYMAIFDQMSANLSPFLVEGNHKLLDLYELVQYAGNIVPRLYLMVCVGAAYMKRNAASDATQLGVVQDGSSPDTAEVPPIKELLADLLDMVKGVQHPMRGLFIRYYLSVMTRDHMPNSLSDSPRGTLENSIQFILQNFIEMNKLWVRLQYVGHSSEREKRESERKELRVIVGSGLVRLSQLEGLDWRLYKKDVLPSLLGEIVSCRDSIAQDYLMDIIIQVFPEEFHFRTLDLLLAAASQLSKAVNVKQTVISLINRFIDYATRMQQESDEARKSTITVDDESVILPVSGIPPDIPLFDLFWEQISNLVMARSEFSIQDTAALLVSLMNLSLNCYPNRLDYVDQILGLAKERVALAKKTALRDKKTLDSILQLLLKPIEAYRYNPLTLMKFPSSRSTVRRASTNASAQNIVIEPPPVRVTRSNSYCGHYTDLLKLLPHAGRRKVANAVALSAISASCVSPTTVNPVSNVSKAIDSSASVPKDRIHIDKPVIPPFIIDSKDGVEAIFGELCTVLVADCGDGDICGATIPAGNAKSDDLDPETEEQSVNPDDLLDWLDIQEEQNLVARLVQLVKTRDGHPDDDVELLATLRRFLGTGGDVRIRFTLPPFVFSCFRVAQSYLTLSEMQDSELSIRLLSLYQFIKETIAALSRAKFVYDDGDDLYADVPVQFGTGLQQPAEHAIRLFLSASHCANQSGHAEAAYEFFVEALSLYEDTIVSSQAQLTALPLVMGCLQSLNVLNVSNAGQEGGNDESGADLDTISGKCVDLCGRLLKKADQSRMLILASQIFWMEKPTEGVSIALGTLVSKSNKQGRDAISGMEHLLGSKSRVETTSVKSAANRGRNGMKVLECLQKALVRANAVLDPALQVELYVLILERYLWMFENSVDSISVRHLNSLVELIHNAFAAFSPNTDNVGDIPEKTPSIFTSTNSGSTSKTKSPEGSKRHFESILIHLRKLKREEEARLRLDLNGGGFASAAVTGRYQDLNL
ncbi:Vacuolar protein sorting-associated protein 35 [Chytriomyces hyalinus]|nr:Vacuolar protein sorting-associated protein 35 [Chytriomyces hyalinus]